MTTALSPRSGRVPQGEWRAALRSVWSGYPRASASAAAARQQLRQQPPSRAYSSAASSSTTADMHVEGAKEEGPVLVAETATAASFRTFGRLVGIGEDGATYAHARTCTSVARRAA